MPRSASRGSLTSRAMRRVYWRPSSVPRISIQGRAKASSTASMVGAAFFAAIALRSASRRRSLTGLIRFSNTAR